MPLRVEDGAPPLTQACAKAGYDLKASFEVVFSQMQLGLAQIHCRWNKSARVARREAAPLPLPRR